MGLAGVLAVAAVGRGAAGPAAALGIAAAGLVAYARRWARLARRSGVGARSERRVRRALAPLRAEGWGVRHPLNWRGRGDIDHVAIAPRAVGLAFVIETKTRTYAADQIARTAACARWVASRRRRWCPRGAVPVLFVMRPDGTQRSENGVLVVSIDHLTVALRDSAGTRTPGPHSWRRISRHSSPNTVESSPDRVSPSRARFGSDASTSGEPWRTLAARPERWSNRGPTTRSFPA
jgi:Nuclease-related domain